MNWIQWLDWNDELRALIYVLAETGYGQDDVGETGESGSGRGGFQLAATRRVPAWNAPGGGAYDVC